MIQIIDVWQFKGNLQPLEANFHFSEDERSRVDMDIYIDFSCSAVLNGEFFIFGDPNNMTGFSILQNTIKKITNCGMQLIGEMPFDFYWERASCGTFHFPDERIFICFPEGPWPYTTEKCRRWLGSYWLDCNVETPHIIWDHDIFF